MPLVPLPPVPPHMSSTLCSSGVCTIQNVKLCIAIFIAGTGNIHI